jgi:hypothetical protein
MIGIPDTLTLKNAKNISISEFFLSTNPGVVHRKGQRTRRKREGCLPVGSPLRLSLRSLPFAVNYARKMRRNYFSW